MAGTYLAQVCLAADSSIPADVAINTFHFAVDGERELAPDRTDAEVIQGIIPDNIDENGIHGDLCDLYATLGSYLSVTIDPAASRIKYYRLEDAEPRVPLLELPMTPAFVTGTTAMPAEIAACLSYQAAPQSGVSQARRRNRIYFGPCSASVLTGFTGVMGSGVRQDFADAMENLSLNSNTQAGWTWIVYSPTNAAGYAVDNGWVDNAFDSQRRRGPDPSERTSWTQPAE